MTKRSGPQRIATDAREDRGSYPLHSMVVPKSEEDSDARASGIRVPVARPHRLPEPRVELFCPFASGRNSHAETVQRESVDWAVRSGLIPAAQIAHLDGAKIGWLNALVFHSAPLEVLRLAADWTTLFCSLDDSVELYRRGPVELSTFLARALATFRGQAERVSSPVEIAFADLRRRMLGLAGPQWTERFSQRLEEIFGAFLWEEINRWKCLRPRYAVYRVMRAVTVGLRPQFLLGELALGIELSHRARSHPDIRRLETHASRAVGWANDINTYAKEVEQGEVHNLVLVLMEAKALSLRQALRRAAAVHDDEVRAFLWAHSQLRYVPGERDSIEHYITMLRSWMRGHLDWARETKRYGARAQDWLRHGEVEISDT